MTTANIASFLPELAETRPYAMAVAAPAGRDWLNRPKFQHYTFKQLNEAADAAAHGLVHVGIRRGVRTVLMVTPGLDFSTLVFALFKIGAIPVVVDPGMGIRKLGECLREAEPAAFIGIPKAHVARLLFGWASQSLKTLVTVGTPYFWGGHSLSDLVELGKQGGTFPVADTKSEDMAAVLFTSGSTGVPKGAVYSHGNFLSQVECIRNTYDIQPGEVDLATFPLFGLFDPALGMTTVVPDMDASKPGFVNPDRIKEAIEAFGATNMFGSPALLRRVISKAGPENWKFSSLKRVISAGAPVPGDVLERWHKVLNDDVQIYTPYGATESLPVASVGSRTIIDETFAKTGQGAGVCVGLPVENVTVKIIKITDEPIKKWSDDLTVEAGKIGEIAVFGPRVTQSYFRRDNATELAKIAGKDGKKWHRMGDTGYIDDQGRLWFCGRKSHRVSAPDRTFFTVQCEGIFNSHHCVFRSALVGPKINGVVEPVICIELDKSVDAAQRLWPDIVAELKELGQQFEVTKPIRHFLVHSSFPVDIRHNSKIFREKLLIWAQKKFK